jgi:hypothetical protein
MLDALFLALHLCQSIQSLATNVKLFAAEKREIEGGSQCQLLGILLLLGSIN